MAKLTRTQASRQLTPSQKAEFHTETGAGRSHVTRQFFGISQSDADLISAELGVIIDRTLSRTA